MISLHVTHLSFPALIKLRQVLSNTLTGERLAVIWDMGGRVEELQLYNPATQGLRNVR